MSPSLLEGDVVFFRNFQNGKTRLKPGHIVIFWHPFKNIIIIKRINFLYKDSIHVTGDNIDFSEDSNKFGLVNNKKIIGIVTSKLINLRLKIFLSQKKRSTFLNPK